MVYQAFSAAIAEAAIAQQRFVPPFSLQRMTWIKPSFLWLMERSNWGLKSGQEHILAVRISRSGCEGALSHAVLTSYNQQHYPKYQAWETDFKAAQVYVQWDPERSLSGQSLMHRSIQVGISRHIVARYVNEWTVSIVDYTPLTRKLHSLIQSGHTACGAI